MGRLLFFFLKTYPRDTGQTLQTLLGKHGVGDTDSRAGVGNSTELGEAQGPGLEQGLRGTNLEFPWLSQARTFCHLVPRSMWCRRCSHTLSTSPYGLAQWWESALKAWN